MSERIFVTGASGRLGLPLVRALVEAGHSVVGLARSEEKAAPVRAIGAECLVGEITDAATLAEGAAGAAAIYHLAGGLRGKGRVPPDIINHQGTRALIQAIGTGRGLRTLLFTSSCAVYGDRSNLWVSEEIPPSPNTRYGKSKADAEAALQQAHREQGLPVKIVRLAAVYGPGFPFVMDERIRKGRGWLPGEGRNYVPIIHVADAVAGLLRAADAGQVGETYHLADPNPPLLKEFYAEVHKHVGGQPMRFWSTWIPSYIQRWAAQNNERVQSRLGLNPRFTPDNLKLFTNSVRLKVEKIESQLAFTWTYPRYTEGLAATFAGGAP